MKNVYQAIAAVMAEMARRGISKDRRNTQGSGYNFRGIDDVYNALAPLLAGNSLVILPRMVGRTCEERVSKNGGNLFYVTVEAEFDLVSADDGSKHTIRTYGEAMDSGDKATNKAMSAAFKYAAFQAFCIPTEGDNDADAHTHQVAPSLPAQVVQMHRNAIKASESAKELQDAYQAAGKAARAIGDEESLAIFTADKDTIKANLGIK